VAESEYRDLGRQIVTAMWFDHRDLAYDIVDEMSDTNKTQLIGWMAGNVVGLMQENFHLQGFTDEEFDAHFQEISLRFDLNGH